LLANSSRRNTLASMSSDFRSRNGRIVDWNISFRRALSALPAGSSCPHRFGARSPAPASWRRTGDDQSRHRMTRICNHRHQSLWAEGSLVEPALVRWSLMSPRMSPVLAVLHLQLEVRRSRLGAGGDCAPALALYDSVSVHLPVFFTFTRYAPKSSVAAVTCSRCNRPPLPCPWQPLSPLVSVRRSGRRTRQVHPRRSGVSTVLPWRSFHSAPG